MLKFFKYFGLAFLIQIFLWVILFALELNLGERAIGETFLTVVLFIYLWPHLLLRMVGGPNGVELFFPPLMIVFYSLVAGTAAVVRNKLTNKIR
jgi:hypothetical protein